ncbi:hypothetical protein Q0Z83_072310 [Actinoplanes sichuanensis]|uniref:Recombinase A n=1 Tax=Actinoplanes sichuanensis TaxID=512349 RepID=A0ABW4AA31_9ACTN|nr:hypothetical protein Q0Z83_072310 [Actinoplanes sichuanensis]
MKEVAGPVSGVKEVAGPVAGVNGQAGLRAGISAGGGTSLLLALLSAASRSGAWCAVVGMPALGAVAAAESGIVLERLALVPEPGPDWPTVVAALIDGVDVVVVAVPGPVSAGIAGRLAARARQRGSLLVPFGDWAGADVHLRVGEGHWDGLGFGRGRLRRREVTVVAQGRGAAARPRQITMWMPGVAVRSVVAPPRADEDAEPPGKRSAEGASASVGPRSAADASMAAETATRGGEGPGPETASTTGRGWG